MSKLGKIVPTVAFSFMFLCISFGYAALATTLSIDGTTSAEAAEYDEIVITGVSAVSGTNADYEFSSRVVPTNVLSSISGKAGQTIVYRITAENFSETETYVYTGITCGNEYADVFGKLSVSAAKNAACTDLLPNNNAATYTAGTPVAPGEEFVFYVKYTLTADLSDASILINYVFKPVKYTVTYLNDNELYAQDCITDNSVAYTVKRDGPQNGSLVFAGWANANAVVVTSYPAGNTNDYTLSAKWENMYLIIFADADGTVLYEEYFTDSSTALSSEGQAIVDQKLAELNAAAGKDMSVSWSSYDIASATSDITVRAIYNYAGYLNMVPVYEQPDDGIVDYYKVMAVDTLPATVEVPGEIGGVPVKVIERITNVDGESDWNNYENTVTKIVVGEGVEQLGWNSLAWTPNLKEVSLPSTITRMDKNVFSRNDLFGNDKKTLTITFNGTRAEWKAIVANSDSAWAGGLKEGTVIRCTEDGGYFRLEKKGIFSSLSWVEYAG